jgi:phosphotransferase system  glucose/maltose/N-acetylglucosamine-specific IIC component
VRSVKPHRIAALFLLLLSVYYEAYRWLPLGDWNGQTRWPVSNGDPYADVLVGLLLIGIAWSFAEELRGGMWLGITLLGLLAARHVPHLWAFYAPDYTAPADQLEAHLKFVPLVGGTYNTDQGHLVLDILFCVCFLVSLAAAVLSAFRGEES